jgi:glycosyltransferase involved in cell wall biosynthesis
MDPKLAPLQLILVGNYAPARQESMLRFAASLERGLPPEAVAVTLLQPKPWLGRWVRSKALSKWAGYLDQFLFFPAALRRTLRRARQRARRSGGAVLMHIADHSNAMFAVHARRLGIPTVVTCHDLLAVRGALGEATDCPASRLGKRLQAWIVRGLQQATVIVCDSTATQEDAERLVPQPRGAITRILLGLNQPFRRLDPEERDRRLAAHPLLKPFIGHAPYLLHVGSGLRRKNREGVLRVFAKMEAADWNGILVFAGEPLSQELRAQVSEFGLAGRVLTVTQPDDALLEALYNGAHALLFPSRFEGFGWPPIEAQACGCPVVCSDAGPLPEVAGEGAILRAPDDEAGMAAALLELQDAATREAWIAKGAANIARFQTGRMVDDYLALYQEVAADRAKEIPANPFAKGAQNGYILRLLRFIPCSQPPSDSWSSCSRGRSGVMRCNGFLATGSIAPPGSAGRGFFRASSSWRRTRRSATSRLACISTR